MAEFYKKPFDLGEPPLFRSLLIKVREDFFILAFALHHIVSDGWSMEILEKDSETFYPMFQEIMEDFALSKAMEEGERAPEVQEENVFQLLK